jgi:sugar O-acyltransferase (sialic acid O-acetyltransferase NeuD family)
MYQAPMRRLFLCGAGNSEGVRLALRVNESERRWDSIALLDDDPEKRGHSLLGIPVTGRFERLAAVDRERTHVVNLIARTTGGRARAGERIASFGIPFAGLISPDVDLLGAEIASDVMAYQNATLGPESSVGSGSVVFMGAAVGHECRVGHHCVIAANAVLNARVVLGDGVYVGSNAVVLPEIEIGAGATIGAGAVVIGNVPAGATVVPNVGAVAGGAQERDDHAPARSRAELVRGIARIWFEILERSDIDHSKNFFDCGGSSLLALRMLQRMESELEVSVRLVDLFQYPSIALLADHLQRTTGSGGRSAQLGRTRAERRRAAHARLRAW